MVCNNSWYQRNKHLLSTKDRLKSWRLVTRYGITLDDFETMSLKQNRRCKICDKEDKLHVDHCHTTGKIRGLLCYHCNNGLGCFKDNVDNLEKATDYLRIG